MRGHQMAKDKDFNEDKYLKEYADSLGRDVPDPK